MLGIRSSHENRRVECRARQCQRLLETCQPAACTLCPRLAAGSLSHQAQRADGLGYLAHSKDRARGRAQETLRPRTWTKPAQAFAGSSWPWRDSTPNWKCSRDSPHTKKMAARQPECKPADLSDDIVNLEGLIHDREPFRAGSGTPFTILRHRQLQRIQQRNDFLSRRHVREVWPRTKRLLVKIFKRDKSSREKFPIDDAFGKALDASKTHSF